MTHWRHYFFFWDRYVGERNDKQYKSKENKTDHYVIIYDLILAQNFYFSGVT